MSSKEVNDLITVVNNLGYPVEECVQAFILLSELWSIADCIASAEWDKTISYLYSDEVSLRILRPMPEEHEAWQHDHVPVPEGGLYFVPDYMTTGSGINTSEATLDLWQVLCQLPHHSRPGGCNPIIEIVFNYAFQVDLHSIFEYMLERILSPTYGNGRKAFLQHYTSILVQPLFYEEGIARWNQANPDRPYVPIAHREPLTVQWLDVVSSFLQNLLVNDVLAIII